MEYAEALKKVTAAKPKENYMVIQFAYNCKIVLPHKDAISFMSALNNAEILEEPYNDQHRISEFDRTVIEARIMSNAEYTRFKIAALLGVKPEELKTAEFAR